MNRQHLHHTFEVFLLSRLYFRVQQDVASKFKRSTKRLYDTIKCDEDSSENDALPELIIDNFDDEQIWQELELQNDDLVNRLIADVSKVSVCKDFAFGVQPKKTKDDVLETYGESSHGESEEIVESSDNRVESDDDLDDLDIDLSLGKKEHGLFDDGDIESEEERELEKILDKAIKEREEEEEFEQHSGSKIIQEDDEENDEDEHRKENKRAQIKKSIPTNKAPKRRTVVDDTFFSMADMEAFLDKEDFREERKHRKKKDRDSSSEEEDEEGIDYFADDHSSVEDDDETDGVIPLYPQK